MLECELVFFPSLGAYHCTARPLFYGCLWASVLMAVRLQSARLFLGRMLRVFSSRMLPNTLPPRKPAAPGCGEKPGLVDRGFPLAVTSPPATMLPNSVAPKAGLARVPAPPWVTSLCFTFSQSPPVGGCLVPRLWLGFRVGRDTQQKPQLLRAFHLQEPRRPCQAALPSLVPPLPREGLA